MRGVPEPALREAGSGLQRNDSNTLQAAVALAEAGYPVFPCAPDKRPRVQGGFKAASSDPKTVRAWWARWPDALIGLPTGERTGVVVLDVDVRPDKDGEETLRQLQRDIPATLQARTPSGGRHLYFRHPGFPVRCSAGKLGKGLDVRGDGGYVIVPPSRGYAWVDATRFEPDKAAPLPDWISRVEDRPPPKAQHGEAAIREAAEKIRTAPDGRRNDTLNREAFALFGLVKGGSVDRETVEGAIREAALAAGLDEAEVDRTLLSAWEAARPRAIHYMEGVPIPPGYRITRRGVFADEDQLAFLPAWVSAISRDPQSQNWGRLVHWTDLDGAEHSEAIPAGLFHSQGPELAQRLAGAGLPIVPGKERELIRYLAAFRPNARLTSATATGWVRESFVLPGATIGEPEGERIVLQVAEPGHYRAFGTSGSLEAWQRLIVGAPPVVRFLIQAALAAPLRHPLGVEAGGFHLSGPTSRGKTGALQAAASVWGCGADPSVVGGAEAFIRRWNSTANALEGLAALHNDLPLLVDEVGEGDAKNFGATIYRIMSGTGRSRARRDGGLALPRAWRVLVLSTGELPVSEYIEEGGSRVRGGQLVRLLDIPVDTIFPNAEAADRIKRGCAENYGHAGPGFIKWALPRLDAVRARWRSFDMDVIGPARGGIRERARNRFALVALAGRLAAEAEILPWTSDDATACAAEVYRLWLRGTTTDEGHRGIGAVRDFISRNAARFQTPEQEARGVVPRDRAGWRRGDFWHFTREAFREACAGANETATKRALLDAGLLHVSHRLNSEIRVDGSKTRVVSVRSDILSFADSMGDAGDAGDGADKHRPARRPPSTGDVGDVGDTGLAVPHAVPHVPHEKNGRGTPKTRMNTGPSPMSPMSPTKNDNPGMGDANKSDDLPLGWEEA